MSEFYILVGINKDECGNSDLLGKELIGIDSSFFQLIIVFNSFQKAKEYKATIVFLIEKWKGCLTWLELTLLVHQSP